MAERVRIKTRTRQRIDLSKPNKSTDRATRVDMALFIGFWLLQIVQFWALYKRHYSVYTFSRAFVVPWLIVRIIASPLRTKLGLYINLTILAALLADLFTIFGNENLAYVGLSFYTISYLAYGCHFQQLKVIHNSTAIFFLLFCLVIGAIAGLWIGAPDLREKVIYVQSAFHTLVILMMLYLMVAARHKLNPSAKQFLGLASLGIIATNLIFALDVVYFQRTRPFVDALVGLGNGIYLFFLVKGALAGAKREHVDLNNLNS